MFLMKRQGETHKQYQDRLIKHIQELRETNAQLNIDILQLQEMHGVVHINNLKRAEERINKLVEKLQRFGLWQGE